MREQLRSSFQGYVEVGFHIYAKVLNAFEFLMDIVLKPSKAIFTRATRIRIIITLYDRCMG